MVTVKELIERAKAMGLPVTYLEFTETEETPIPEPPYLVYLITNEKGRGADTKNNIKEMDFALELYTDLEAENREELESQIEETILYDIEYEKFVAKIESENMMQSAYEVKGLLVKTKGAK